MLQKKIISFYIATRDYTKLAVTIFYPADYQIKKIPVAWKYDRYHTRNKLPDEDVAFENFKDIMLEKGIAIAIVDSRGSGASFGHASAPFSKIEQNDLYDVTEWFASQSWCTGNVGMFGRSYSGISQYLAAAAAPPHLKIIVPEMALFDLYQFAYPGGIFRNDFAHEWDNNIYQLDQNLPAKGVDNDEDNALLTAAREEHLLNEDVYALFSQLPYRDSTLKNEKTSIYETNSPLSHLKEIQNSNVAILHIAGWHDLWVKDMLIAFSNLNLAQTIMIGPWSHSSYCDFLTETVTEKLALYLLNSPEISSPKKNTIIYYTLSDNPAKAWHTAYSWPLPETTKTTFYLGKNSPINSLKKDEPNSEKIVLNYKINYNTTSGKNSRWANGYGRNLNYTEFNQLTEKSINFVTEALLVNQKITGHPLLEIYMMSNSIDFDLFAYISEIHPDGFVEYITEGCLRASRRNTSIPDYNNFDMPYHSCRSDVIEAVPLNQPILYQIELLPISKIIHKSHRLQLSINFCDTDNTLTPIILPEPEISILCYKDYPSRLIMPFI